MAVARVNEGVFQIAMNDANAEPYTQKIGYIKENILDSGNSDTSAVTADLFNFAVAMQQFVGGSAREINVVYTAEISES